MKLHSMKKVISLAAAAALTLSLAACSGGTQGGSANSPAPGSASPVQTGTDSPEGTVYKVGICNYVDDASLNQIVENIQSQLEAIGAERGVRFEVSYDNCNADSTVMNQIIANFIADEVDLMIGVATPVAVAMQTATEDNQIPVVFSAVSRSGGLRPGGVPGGPRRQHHRNLRLPGHQLYYEPDLCRGSRCVQDRPAL